MDRFFLADAGDNELYATLLVIVFTLRASFELAALSFSLGFVVFIGGLIVLLSIVLDE